MTDIQTNADSGQSPAVTGTQDRIQHLIEQRRAADQEAQRAAQQYASLPPRPAGDESHYIDHAEWRRAVVHEAVTEAQRAAAAATHQEAQQRAFHARAQTFQARVDDFKQGASDYDQVARNPSLQITPVMAEAITESGAGPQVSYWLGQNPNEAARIASLPPMRQVVEIGRLEASLGSTPRTGRTTAAPSPSRTYSGAATAASGYDPNTGSNEDYRAWRASQKATR